MTARRRGPLPRYATPGHTDLTLPPAPVPAADYRRAVETTERIAREAEADRVLVDEVPTPRTPSPTGPCGHPSTAWHTTSRTEGGQGVTCGICGATGMIEP